MNMAESSSQGRRPVRVVPSRFCARCGGVTRPCTFEGALEQSGQTMDDAQLVAFVQNNRRAPIALQYSEQHRGVVLCDLYEVSCLAAAVYQTWRESDDPVQLVFAARGLRDAVAALAVSAAEALRGRDSLRWRDGGT